MSSATDAPPDDLVEPATKPPRRRATLPPLPTPQAPRPPARAQRQTGTLAPRKLAATPDALHVALPELRRLLVDEPFSASSAALVDTLALALAPATVRLYLAAPTASLGEHESSGGPSLGVVASAARGASGKLTRPRGSVIEGASHRKEDPLMREMMANPRSLFASDGESPGWLASDFFARLPAGTRGAWPLVAHGLLLGLLVVGTGRAMQQHECAILDELSTLLTLAHGQAPQMRALHRISLAVGNHLSDDPTSLLDTVLTSAMELLAAHAGVIYQADDQRRELEVVIASGLKGDHRGERVPLSQGLPGQVALHGRGRVLLSYRKSPWRSPLFAAERIRTALAVPLLRRGRVIGVVEVFDPAHGGSFDDDDTQLLEVLAAQAAQAIENARTIGALEASVRKLRELDRLKDDLIATASHELRTPLTGVLGFLDLLRMLPAVRNDATASDYARMAATAGREMNAIAERMLNASRADAGQVEVHVEPVRLAAVTETVIERYRELALAQEAGHVFEILVPEDVEVQADTGALREILDNLLSNAVKYSPNGGTITVRATADLASGSIAATGYVLLTVSDQGLGIAPSDQGKLFERFIRLESAREHEIRGTGLGLYICRQLAHAMNGDVWLLSSTPGWGSVFALSLPVASTHDAS